MSDLQKLRELDGLSVEKPQLFKIKDMLITFVHPRSDLKDSRTLWETIGSANYAIPGTKLINMGQDDWTLRQLSKECVGRVPLYMHPSLYRRLKLEYPALVGGAMSRGEVEDALVTGNLGQEYYVPTREDFGLEAVPMQG